MSGAFAVFAGLLCFAIPLAVPLFVQRWRTFAIIVALAVAFFAWLTWDIERTGGVHWIGSFLGGLMLFGFAAGAIAKFVMLVGRRPDRAEP
jgi:hypothetical protein